jgi:Isochorismatase family
MPLLARDDSLLVVIDLQPGFSAGDRLDADDRRRAAEAGARAAWLAAVADALGIPAMITEEDPERNGPTDAAVLAALRRSAPVFIKPVFGLADCPDIMAAIRATGRRTAVLAGFETDVCVTLRGRPRRRRLPGHRRRGRHVLAVRGARAGNGAAARAGFRARALQGRLLRLDPHPGGRARLREGPPAAR